MTKVKSNSQKQKQTVKQTNMFKAVGSRWLTGPSLSTLPKMFAHRRMMPQAGHMQRRGNNEVPTNSASKAQKRQQRHTAPCWRLGDATIHPNEIHFCFCQCVESSGRNEWGLTPCVKIQLDRCISDLVIRKPFTSTTTVLFTRTDRNKTCSTLRTFTIRTVKNIVHVNENILIVYIPPGHPR